MIRKSLLSEEYNNHFVFQTLSDISEFYERLGMSTMFWIDVNAKTITNLNTYTYSSIGSTVASIQMVLKAGRINDAYSLIRKYYDSAITNIYVNVCLDKLNDEPWKSDELIDGWVSGRVKMKEYRTMIDAIRTHETTATIMKEIEKDGSYKKIRERCNNNSHYNFYKYYLLNIEGIFIKNREKYLNMIEHDIWGIFILHIMLTFALNDNYMMSDDYVDYLDCGQKPPLGSEKWVAPYIEDMIMGEIKKRRSDLVEMLISTTNMDLASNRR